jgi:hypothetical protein
MIPVDVVEPINYTTPSRLPTVVTLDAPANAPMHKMAQDFLAITFFGIEFKSPWHQPFHLYSDEKLASQSCKLINDSRGQMSAIESDGDSTLSEPELQSTDTIWDEIAPESPDREINWDEKDSRASDGASVSYRSKSTEDTDNPYWTSRWAGGEENSEASDGTSVSTHSRRTEDTDNPHWSSRWAGWGLTDAYLDDGHGDYGETEYLDDVVTEFNSLRHQAE